MTTRNPITGDEIKSKPNYDKYRSNYGLIFGRHTKRKAMSPPIITENTSKIKEVVRKFHVKSPD